MGEKGRKSSPKTPGPLQWLALGVIFLALLAVTGLAFVGGFLVVLAGIDWLAVTVLSEQGGRDFWAVHLLMIVSFPVYVLVAFKLFTKGYATVRESADKYVAFGLTDRG